MEDLSACREIWIESPNGSSLCALINGDLGWLMFLRASGDAGFSSRNPDYAGPSDAKITYVLSNGQADSYPAAWALPVATVEQALFFFRRHGSPPSFIAWHNDTNDGSSIPQA
jgi:hypothetical protein